MKFRNILLPVVLLLVALVLLNIDSAMAQCPMCKAAAESNIKEGGKHALGLNAGILYLFVTPYLLAATLGFIWWRNQQKVKKEQETAANNS